MWPGAWSFRSWLAPLDMTLPRQKKSDSATWTRPGGLAWVVQAPAPDADLRGGYSAFAAGDGVGPEREVQIEGGGALIPSPCGWAGGWSQPQADDSLDTPSFQCVCPTHADLPVMLSMKGSYTFNTSSGELQQSHFVVEGLDPRGAVGPDGRPLVVYRQEGSVVLLTEEGASDGGPSEP